MKRHQKLMSIAAVSGALALVMSGCASGDTGGDNTGGNEKKVETSQADYNPQPRENLKKGGDVTFAINEITPQMNPFHGDASADTTRLASWYTPQVFLMDPDGTPHPNPSYLDSWEIGEEGGNTVINGTINEDAVWNDGSPIDWTAFETTWIANRSSEEGYAPNATDGYKEIKSVEQGETEKDVVVTFDGEFAWPQMVFLTGILNPHVNTPEIFNEGFIEEPHAEWGAGPYKIDKFDSKGQVVSFVPNENWWGNEPLLDEVTFRGLDASASINAFKNGEIDTVGVATKDRLEQVQDMDGIEIYRAQQTANTLLEVDSEKPQFKDLEVRKAFYMGLNVEQQMKIAWNGLGYEEEPGGSFILYSFQPHFTNSVVDAGWEYNPDEANKILDEAGWELNDDGVRAKDGVELSVTYPIFSDDPTQKALAQSIQQSMKEIGFEINIDVRSPQDFSTDYTSKNWDIMSLRFTSSDPFGAAWFCQMYCSDSGLNLSATGTEEIDTKIHEDLESITDSEEQTKKAMEMESEIMSETWGIFPLYNGPTITAATEGLANLTPEPYVGLDLFGVTPVENVGWEK
ncbi:ABC transporter family substrate-binding protein [Microbacterium sp. MPKO10]|uniref:ABC transporter family substrate-binding protein n=1 Tax=Microbacterium sp. MPKO10 TaxID=2989818 RepID=UPI0022362993|nr:ABC transporter family substrate-binding protein [Microbacterium sp. MPKO10]MCW4458073.1 ABC transporter family substrate-binding protein [Microbacterium sp. MPKO10]